MPIVGPDARQRKGAKSAAPLSVPSPATYGDGKASRTRGFGSAMSHADQPLRANLPDRISISACPKKPPAATARSLSQEHPQNIGTGAKPAPASAPDSWLVIVAQIDCPPDSGRCSKPGAGHGRARPRTIHSLPNFSRANRRAAPCLSEYRDETGRGKYGDSNAARAGNTFPAERRRL